MANIEFTDFTGHNWIKVIIDNYTVGYIHKKDKYFEAADNQPVFEIEDLEAILSEMKKL